jgi:hypothetical protein
MYPSTVKVGTEDGVRTDMQHPRRIANPAGVQAHVNDRAFYLRHIPSVAVVQQKTSCGTHDILAQVALGAPGGFAAFHDLLVVTMRALDRDACHGPLLPDRGCQDQTQYDISLSPSPRLEHYPLPRAKTHSMGQGKTAAAAVLRLLQAQPRQPASCPDPRGLEDGSAGQTSPG